MIVPAINRPTQWLARACLGLLLAAAAPRSTAQTPVPESSPVASPGEPVAETREQREARRLRESEALAIFERLRRERESALIAYHHRMPGLRTERKRREAYQEFYPRTEVWGPRFAEMAERYPGTRGAALAWVWIVEYMNPCPLEQKARRLLLSEHLSRPCLAHICKALADPRRTTGASELQFIFEKSPVESVKAAALVHLAYLDLKVLENTTSPKVEQRLQVHIGWLKKRFAKWSVDGQPCSVWATRLTTARSRMETGRFFQEWVANDLDGAPYRLEQDRGRVVLLFFWKSASVPSRKAVPYVEGLRNACEGKPLTILGVSGDHDLARAKRWSRILNLPYKSLHDPQKAKVPNRFGVQDWPTFFVLDPAGRILASEVGFDAAKAAVLEAIQAIESAQDPIPEDSNSGDRHKAPTQGPL